MLQTGTMAFECLIGLPGTQGVQQFFVSGLFPQGFLFTNHREVHTKLVYSSWLEDIQGVYRKSVMFGWVHKFKASHILGIFQCALVV